MGYHGIDVISKQWWKWVLCEIGAFSPGIWTCWWRIWESTPVDLDLFLRSRKRTQITKRRRRTNLWSRPAVGWTMTCQAPADLFKGVERRSAPNCIKSPWHMYHPVIKNGNRNPPFDIFQWTFRWAHHLQCGIFQKTPVTDEYQRYTPCLGFLSSRSWRIWTTNTWPLRRNTRKPCRWGPGPGLIGLSWMPQHIKMQRKGAAPKLAALVLNQIHKGEPRPILPIPTIYGIANSLFEYLGSTLY